MRCRCDGLYEGCHHGNECGNQGGGYRSPYYCESCDERRIAHLTKSFERLKMKFSDGDERRGA